MDELANSLACRPVLTARGSLHALILYKIHAKILDRHGASPLLTAGEWKAELA